MASTRFRACRLGRALAPHGIDADFSYFWTRGELAALASSTPRGKASALLRGTARRLRRAFSARAHDVVVVQRESFPLGPPLLEMIAARANGRPLVLDLDDALYLPFGDIRHAAGLSSAGRLMLISGRARALARLASEIVVASRALETWARRFTDRVTWIPTVVDTDEFSPRERPDRDVPVIGWVGTPSSLGPLLQLLPLLEEVASRQPFELRIVGAKLPPGTTRHLTVKEVAWTAEAEPSQYSDLDIGLGPLFADRWSQAKPGFKALIYRACGVPAVCSPIGDAELYVRHGETGFLAADDAGWRGALERLLADPRLRREMGRNARTLAEAGPDVQTEAPRLAAVLERAAGRRPH